MKKIISLFLSLTFLISYASAAVVPPQTVSPCAVLMERDTGRLLYQKDAHKKLPPASVTKVMTLLLVMEALDSGSIKLEDMVPVSEHAAGMGGSQVFLAPGEQMSVDDMLKATVIASGNDASVALAEFIAGSEDGFVGMMNKRAEELGMEDTCFKNCTGLDTPGHETSAYDIALMSRELIKHKKIRDYSTTWMDSLRDGAFQLANTNKLIRSYKGITGLKTGSTSVAKFCLSATAERNGMELIATIMAAPSSKERFADASKLLDYGFANYALYDASADKTLDNIPVVLGTESEISLKFDGTASVLTEKGELSKITSSLELPEKVEAPVEKGQKIGVLKVISGEETIAEVNVVSCDSVPKIGVGGIFYRMLGHIFMK